LLDSLLQEILLIFFRFHSLVMNPSRSNISKDVISRNTKPNIFGQFGSLVEASGVKQVDTGLTKDKKKKGKKKVFPAQKCNEMSFKFEGLTWEQVSTLGEDDQMEHMLYDNVSSKEALSKQVSGQNKYDQKVAMEKSKLDVQPPGNHFRQEEKESQIQDRGLVDLENKIREKKQSLVATKMHYGKLLEAASAEYVEITRKIELLKAEGTKSCSELEKEIALLATEISAKKIKVNPGKTIERCLECPVCMDVCKPPTQVWQCPEGHIICGSCVSKPGLKICPQCRTSLAGRLSRNRALEELARKML